jgi:hypothetical protein
MTNRIVQSFPFSTAYTEFEDWVGNFIQWYGKEAIGQGTEAEWREIADQICAAPSFAAYGLPSSSKYEHWQDWADEVSQAINGPTH